jgi:hypothetical protein
MPAVVVLLMPRLIELNEMKDDVHNRSNPVWMPGQGVREDGKSFVVAHMLWTDARGRNI